MVLCHGGVPRFVPRLRATAVCHYFACRGGSLRSVRASAVCASVLCLGGAPSGRALFKVECAKEIGSMKVWLIKLYAVPG